MAKLKVVQGVQAKTLEHARKMGVNPKYLSKTSPYRINRSFVARGLQVKRWYEKTPDSLKHIRKLIGR